MDKSDVKKLLKNPFTPRILYMNALYSTKQLYLMKFNKCIPAHKKTRLNYKIRLKKTGLVRKGSKSCGGVTLNHGSRLINYHYPKTLY